MQDNEHLKRDLLIDLVLVLQRVAPAIIAFLTLRLGLEIAGIPMSEAYSALFVIVFLLALILFPSSMLSSGPDSPRIWTIAMATFWSWTALIMVVLLLGYVTKTSAIYSRRLLLTWVVVAPLLIVLARLVIDALLVKLRQRTSTNRRAVIAGFNDHAEMLAERIAGNEQYGLSIDGYFDDRDADRLGYRDGEPILGKLSELPRYVQEHRINLIYITLPLRNVQRMSELLDELRDTTASIYFVPDVFVFDLIQCRTTEIGGLPVVALCETPFYGTRGVGKRMSDIVIALAALLFTSPLLLAIAAGVKLTTPGSVIFKQRRYGLDGHEITVYKFRTMTVSEDSDQVQQARRNDNRVTRFGAFLRRYSLDELPQFINVIQGRMSVVGPRPHAVSHNEEYRRLIKGYMVRHKVRPGITGLAQVRGFRGETATVDDMRRRVESDLEYLRNWSLDLDFKIILKTAKMVFSDKKAY